MPSAPMGCPPWRRMGKMADAELDSLIGRFCRSLQVERNLSPNTVRSYRKGLEEYRDWAAKEGVDPLRPTHRQLRLFLSSLTAAGLGRASVNNRLSALRSFFRWLEVEGVVDANPAAVLQGPKMPRRLPDRISPSEMEAILAVHASVDAQGRPRTQTATDLRDQAILEFLYATGARVSEVAGLQLGDVDFAGATVRLMGKGRKQRIVPLYDRAVGALSAYLDCGRPELAVAGKPTQAVFLSTRGRPMSADAIRTMFKKTLTAAGVSADYHPHDMRHTFASDLLEGGADLRSVQEMLGHASLSTTQVYTHISNERLWEVHHQAHPRG